MVDVFNTFLFSMHVCVCIFQGYHSDNSFIATQWPLPGTINDIWRLLYDFKVNTMVMLHENKCGRVSDHHHKHHRLVFVIITVVIVIINIVIISIICLFFVIITVVIVIINIIIISIIVWFLSSSPL